MIRLKRVLRSDADGNGSLPSSAVKKLQKQLNFYTKASLSSQNCCTNNMFYNHHWPFSEINYLFSLNLSLHEKTMSACNSGCPF